MIEKYLVIGYSHICKAINYRPVIFESYDGEDKLIYHTNVMMSIGSEFAVVCSEAIKNAEQRQRVLASLRQTGKKVIEISLDQMNNMCANILEVRTRTNEKAVVMSKRAYDHFSPSQQNALAEQGKLIIVDIQTIEKIGGGSARCMMAEVF